MKFATSGCSTISTARFLCSLAAATAALIAADLYAAVHVINNANVCWVCVGDLTHTECTEQGIDGPHVEYTAACPTYLDASCTPDGNGGYTHCCIDPQSLEVCP